MIDAHGMLVCPYSCNTVEHLVTERELAVAARARAGPSGHDEDDAAHDFVGAMGRAFALGYNCRDERELARVCGVKL